jgi:hypothetical protein
MSKHDTPADDLAERRDYFRINDAVALEVEPIAADALSDYEARFETDRLRCGLANYLSHRDEQLLPKRKKLEKRDPDLVSYLDELERRISLLADLVVNDGDGEPCPSHVVNISGSGIDFAYHKPLPEGSYALLRIRLFPEQTRIMAIGRVMHAGHYADSKPGDAERGDFRAGMHFVRIHEEDRELLIKHIHSLQMQSLRFQRS